MKKLCFFLPALFAVGIFAANGQTQQALTEGRIVTATLAADEVHTYSIRLGNDAEYFIAWDDYDTSDGFADIMVGVRGDQWGQYSIDVQDYGNFDQQNVIRLINSNHPNHKTNPLDSRRSGRSGSGWAFAPNNEYIIEVRGLGTDSSGTYRIVFY